MFEIYPGGKIVSLQDIRQALNPRVLSIYKKKEKKNYMVLNTRRQLELPVLINLLPLVPSSFRV